MHRPTLLLTCPLLFLTLSLGEARATAVFTAPLNAARAPDAAQTPTTGRNEPLERTYWRATELVGKPAPPPPPEPTRETHLQFDAGRVSGSDGGVASLASACGGGAGGVGMFSHFSE